MAELMGNIATIMNFAAALFFYGGLAIIVVMLRKMSKDLAEIKRKVSDVEETLLLAPRPAERT